MAVSDYDPNNQAGGQGPLSNQAAGAGGGGGRALTKKWGELTQKQKDRFGSRSAFKDAKGEYNVQQNANNEAFTSTERSRKAGDKMKDLNQQLREAREAGQDNRVDKLQTRLDRQESRVYGDGEGSIADNYDASAGGSGSRVNKARTSGKDLKELEQRYGKQAVVDYMQGEGASTLGGKKAQNLLNKYVTELTETPTPTPDPSPEPSPEPGPTPTPDPSDPPVDDAEPPGVDDPTPVPTPTPTPQPTPTVPDDDDEQTDDTMPITGGGNNNGGIDTGDADNGGVSGGTGNTGGNNQQEGTGNMVGNGNTNTGGNEQNTEVNYGNDSVDFGKNNNLNNVNIDQSERFYGGNQNNMSIVYGEGSSNLNTAPVSDLTMMGLGKADDSPAAQAKFVDMYQDLNKQAQKQYSNVGTSTANKYIQNAAATNPIDYVALNQEIGRSIERHYSNSTEQGALYMGDPYNYRPPNYEMPTPLDPVENNVGDATDKANDNMDDED